MYKIQTYSLKAKHIAHNDKDKGSTPFKSIVKKQFNGKMLVSKTT